MSGNMVALGDVAQFINGAAFKPEDWGEDGLPIIRIQNLTDRTKPYNRTTRVVADKLYVQPGDLLVSWSATLGVFVWDRDDVGLLNQHIFRVVPDDSKVSKLYLRHSLEGALASMQKHLHGATMQHVNRGEFLATPLYLPPLGEQRRIAAILDQAETLRTQRRTALAQLDSLTQSIFLDMFGDPVTNPKGWTTQTLDEVTIKVTDGEHLNPVFSEFGMPIVMAGNVLLDRIDLSAAKRVESSLGQQFRKKCGPEIGDLLIVGRGATIGRLCRVSVPDTFCLMGSVILVKPDRALLDERFLSGMLALPSMHAMLYKTSGSSAQQAIYLKDVKRLVCPLPPLPLQQTFATRIQAIESLKTTHRAALAELDALFASLQQRAFAGEL